MGCVGPWGKPHLLRGLPALQEKWPLFPPICLRHSTLGPPSPRFLGLPPEHLCGGLVTPGLWGPRQPRASSCTSQAQRPCSAQRPQALLRLETMFHFCHLHPPHVGSQFSKLSLLKAGNQERGPLDWAAHSPCAPYIPTNRSRPAHLLTSSSHGRAGAGGEAGRAASPPVCRWGDGAWLILAGHPSRGSPAICGENSDYQAGFPTIPRSKLNWPLGTLFMLLPARM